MQVLKQGLTKNIMFLKASFDVYFLITEFYFEMATAIVKCFDLYQEMS